MAWSFEVLNPRRDPGNFNIVVTIQYTDGATVVSENFAGVDLTDAVIAKQAKTRIENVLEVGDAAMAAIKLGPGTIPDDPITDPKQQAIFDASRELQQAVQKAQLKNLGSPDVDAAVAKLEAAQAA